MTIDTLTRPARASGTFRIGGDLPVARLGFGAMRLTGPGIWGEPRDDHREIAIYVSLRDLCASSVISVLSFSVSLTPDTHVRSVR